MGSFPQEEVGGKAKDEQGIQKLRRDRYLAEADGDSSRAAGEGEPMETKGSVDFKLPTDNISSIGYSTASHANGVMLCS